VVSEVFTEGVAGVSAEEFAGWFAELGVFIAPNCSSSRAGAESAGWTKLGTYLIPGMGTTGSGPREGEVKEEAKIIRRFEKSRAIILGSAPALRRGTTPERV
jgi:hypothetical protein